MNEPTLDQLLDAFTQCWPANLSLPFAAAHLLARGADGPALRELAGLSDREVDTARALLSEAYAEAQPLLEPAVRRRAVRPLEAADDDELPPAVILVYSSEAVGDRIDLFGDFIEQLQALLQAAGAGEVDGPSDAGDEQWVFCYGEDLAQLEALVASQLLECALQPIRVDRR